MTHRRSKPLACLGLHWSMRHIRGPYKKKSSIWQSADQQTSSTLHFTPHVSSQANCLHKPTSRCTRASIHSIPTNAFNPSSPARNTQRCTGRSTRWASTTYANRIHGQGKAFQRSSGEDWYWTWQAPYPTNIQWQVCLSLGQGSSYIARHLLWTRSLHASCNARNNRCR